MLEQLSKDNFFQLLNRFSTPELEGLIKKFPYFHQAHLLLARKYQQDNDPRFDEQLQIAALYTQNRDLFYDIFNSKPEAKPVEFVPANTLTKDAVTPVTEELKVDELPAVEEATVESVTETEPIKQAYSPIEVVEEVEEAVALEQEPKAEAVLPTIEHKDVEERVLSTAPMETVSSKEVEEAVEANVDEAAVEQLEVVEPALEESGAVAEEAVEEISLDEPHTFGEWLKAFPIKATVEEAAEILQAEVAHEDEDLDKIIKENANIDYLHTLVQEETHYSKGLDKFIEEQKIKHKPAELKKVVKETELDPALITETLAGLYAAQRKYTKAIKAYEILTLKFPEKSDLFAARIQYLKKLM